MKSCRTSIDAISRFAGRSFLAAIVLAGIVAALTAMVAWADDALSPFDPIATPPRASFDPERILQGSRLAALGNCASCHTTERGADFAGGVPIETPFGTVHGTNITPDRETGIGAWSLAAFARAMREGVSRDGRHLYPVFPYEHYTRLVDADIEALYAYLMTRTPVRAEATPNRMKLPFGFRPLLAGWKALFLDRSPHRDDPARSAEWNRGAYLADALAHCGACHTPRNAFGAERRSEGFAGGLAEGWYAPALDRRSPSPLPWSAEQLAEYLKTGLARDHAIAGGPMQRVVANLALADEADVGAIAAYIAALMEPATAEQEARARAAVVRAEQGALERPATIGSTAPGEEREQLALGASIYQGACAACHAIGRQLSSAGALRLPLAVAVHDPDPRSLIRIVRDGIVPRDGEPGRWMPAFGASLTDAQLVALLAYLRRYAADAPPWPGLARHVEESRER